MARKAREQYDEPATVEEVAQEPSDGQSGWETPEPITASVHKRHSFKGGDTCIKCGAAKPARVARTTTRARPQVVGNLETLFTLLWAGIGVGVEYQPLFGRKPTKHQLNGHEVEGAPLAVALGKSLQMESAVAGRRINNALKSGNPALYAILNLLLNSSQAKWLVEIGPLLVAPAIVCAAATLPPQVVQQFRPALMTLMIPVLVEQGKMMQQQAAMLEKMEGMAEENLQAASAMVDALLGIVPNGQSTTSNGPP